MKVTPNSSFVSKLTVYALVLSVIQCHSTVRTTMIPLHQGPNEDFLHLDSAPDTIAVNSSVRMSYICSGACRVGLEIVLANPKSLGRVTFRRSWTHVRQFNTTRTKTIPLKFPPAVVYRRDFFLRRTLEGCDVRLRAWLLRLEEEKSYSRIRQYERSKVWIVKSLVWVPHSERPARTANGCPAWGAELMWNRTKDRLEKCSSESDIVRLLTFPFASTGEKFGVIQTFSPFINRELETARLQAVENPRVTMSMWLYLLNWCKEKLCSIVKHVTDRNYTSPLLMLSDTGKIAVQMCLITGEEKAFTSHIVLPLRVWVRLDLVIQNTEVTVVVTPAGPEHRKEGRKEADFSFGDSILYNDTSGYFVFGGGKYMPGFHGYIGPVKYYRLGAEYVVNPQTHLRTVTELTEQHSWCRDVRQFTQIYATAVRGSRVAPADDVCVSYYERLRRTSVQPRCAQTWSWENELKYSAVLKILRKHEKHLISGQWTNRKASLFGRRQYKDVVKRLADAKHEDTDTSLIELLQLCSCWGHHQALLMLAMLHLAGLGVPADQEKAHVYSLMGGVVDHRLALLHLGYKHTQGLDGFPKDPDLAYGYYANIGKQTCVDYDQVQDLEQSVTEYVLLENPEDLQMQSGESNDIIQYLKHQAERGDLESQKMLAQMAFFGSNGMTKDISAALKWYARSAMQLTDPSAMHDYSLMLLKGIGGKKNESLALKLLEKAAAMGWVDSLNALGWYHSTKVKNHTIALQYFRLAAQNGSREGLYNLGVYYLSGLDQHTLAKNETEAFQCFLKAGELGHVEGAVEAAVAFSRGHIAGVPRDPEKAVSLLKQVSERNGHLGFTLQDALRTFQKGSWNEALLKYALLAETGFVLAQLNAAHLCEVTNHGSACQWRYHNYSTHNHAPQESGLLRMGDRYTALGDMVNAVSLYSSAALKGSAQGTYNLAVLTGEGFDIPTHVLEQMQIRTEPQLSRSTVVERLLIRCQQLEENPEEMSPCSLALLGLHVSRVWQEFSRSTVHLAFILTASMMFALATMTQSVLARYTTALAPSIPNQSDSTPEERLTGIPRLAGIPRHLRSLQEAADWVVTASGVCVCALCTVFISHLL